MTAATGTVTNTAADTDVVAFSVVDNFSPVVEVETGDSVGFSGDSLTLDASHSYDPAGTDLSFSWEVIVSPDGATVSPETGNDEVFTFSADASGAYEVQLEVSDGFNDAIEKAFPVSVLAIAKEYTFDVIGAAHHYSEDIIAVVSAGPHQVHIIDVPSGDRESVELPLMPISVAINPNGDEIAVGHDGWVTVIDIETAEVLVSHPVDVQANSVVHGGNGYIYALPPGQWERVRGVRISDGETHEHEGFSVYGGTIMRIHPIEPWIYAANRGLSPSDIEKYDISTVPTEYVSDSPYHGTYAMCGDLWLTWDGVRIITACGNTFRSSEVSSQDMVYAGALDMGDVNRVLWAGHSPDRGEIVTAVGDLGWNQDIPGDAALIRFEDQYLNRLSFQGVPEYVKGGNTHEIVPELVAYHSGDEGVFLLANLESANAQGHSVLIQMRLEN